MGNTCPCSKQKLLERKSKQYISSSLRLGGGLSKSCAEDGARSILRITLRSQRNSCLKYQMLAK